MNKKHQKHQLLITFMANLKPAKHKRTAPVTPGKNKGLLHLLVR